MIDEVDFLVEAVVASVGFSESDRGSCTLAYQHEDRFIVERRAVAAIPQDQG